MDIIQRNFFRLLRSGAYNDTDAIEPMSAFKWKRVFQMVEAQDVAPTTLKGLGNHADDPNLELPNGLMEQWQQAAQNSEKRTIINSPMATFELSNFFLNRRLKKMMISKLLK